MRLLDFSIYWWRSWCFKEITVLLLIGYGTAILFQRTSMKTHKYNKSDNNNNTHVLSRTGTTFHWTAAYRIIQWIQHFMFLYRVLWCIVVDNVCDSETNRQWVSVDRRSSRRDSMKIWYCMFFKNREFHVEKKII